MQQFVKFTDFWYSQSWKALYPLVILFTCKFVANLRYYNSGHKSWIKLSTNTPKQNVSGYPSLPFWHTPIVIGHLRQTRISTLFRLRRQQWGGESRKPAGSYKVQNYKLISGDPGLFPLVYGSGDNTGERCVMSGLPTFSTPRGISDLGIIRGKGGRDKGPDISRYPCLFPRPCSQNSQ